ncbi:MAG: S-layer homology domain-containing protein [Clostridia bacterium]|nr:S-layer homology domain-containing protein [Clostridia bacterium]
MKKIALFLALVLCLSFVSSFAVCAAETIPATAELLKENPERTVGLDCYEVYENISFEVMANAGKSFYEWGWTSHVGRDKTYVGLDFVNVSADAHTGKQAVHVKLVKGQNFYISQTGKITPGQTYEISVWLKRLQEGGTATIHFLFSGKNAGVSQTYARPKVSLKSGVADGWVKRTIRFVAPEYASSVVPQIRFDGAGEYLLDDCSFVCVTDKMPKPSMAKKLPAIESLITEDPSFEGGTVGAEIHTIPQWDETIGDAKISDQYAHTGTKSVELKTVDGSKDAIGIMYLENIKEGATYQVSTWLINPTDLKIDMGYWMHWCSEEKYTSKTEAQLESSKPRWGIKTTFEWQEYVGQFVAPQGAKSAMLYFRHRLCPGSIFMDDVEINMVKPPQPVKADSDEVFYYTEWEKGYVNVIPTYVSDPANTTATFTFQSPAGETLDQKSFAGIFEEFNYEFATSLMAEKGAQYNVNMKITDAAGAVLQEQNFPVHRYDRPLYLGADGIFRKNGKEIAFSMGSGLNMNRIDKHPEKAGITVAQLNADNPNLGYTTKERMDAYYEQGMFVVLNCYTGSKSGGHKDQIDTVKRMANNYKDHPAFFGYKLIDEPYQKGISAAELMAGYKAIRDIDPYHPIYIDDSPVGSYDFLFKFCDIFECDYYGITGSNGGRKMTEIMDEVKKASKGRKPYTVLLPFFDNMGAQATYEEFRHSIYQSFFSGAYGYSYHSFGLSMNGVQNLDSEQFKSLCAEWAPWEKDFAWGCFVTGTYTFVNYQKTDDVLWGTFTDGKDLYAIVLNREKSKPTLAEVPLKDGAGLINIGAFTATKMNKSAAPITGSGTLSLNLEPLEAAVWKITPSEAVDFSVLKNSKFNDVIYYPWAYNAIATLEEKGIVNKVSDEWYGPERNITRGDYAMFLVRTLGLTEGAGENFADVDPSAEYAKELAIGKAAGIINGVGENRFNPEAQITRQDMMTMTSRAMKLAGAADLGSFSDSGNIADYASSHVAAMVAEGLIKGNADGTINPLGNTTRAEAAVIMQRILTK